MKRMPPPGVLSRPAWVHARAVRMRYTEDQIVEAVAWWVPYLGLGDWAIDLEFVPWGQIPGRPHGNAGMSLTYKLKRATLWMPLQPARFPDIDTGYIDAIDDEHRVVHELLHLHTAQWREWSLEMADTEQERVPIDLMEEPFINSMAWALVAMRRDNLPHRFSWEKRRTAKSPSASEAGPSPAGDGGGEADGVTSAEGGGSL